MKRSKWIVALAALWLLSGTLVVGPGEEAVVAIFGRLDERPRAPGLSWRPPWPIGAAEIVSVREVRRLAVGLLATDATTFAGQGRWLTGDRNVIGLRVVLQYSVADPQAYVRRLEASERALDRLVRNATLQVVAGTEVDALLTADRITVQRRIAQRLGDDLDGLEAGLRVESVLLDAVAPPSEAIAAFNDVASAREDRDRQIREAESYRNEVVPIARGGASAVRSEARAQALEAQIAAEGAAQRFEAVAEASLGTRQELRLRRAQEAIEAALPRVRTIVLTSGEVLDLDLLRAAPASGEQ